MNKKHKLPRRCKLYLPLILIALVLLAILPTGCACNCSSGNVPFNGWRPDLLEIDYRIAFKSTRDGNENGDFYLVDPEGENLIKLGGNMVYGNQPVWSPDGTRIAFVTTDLSDGTNISYALHIADEDGNSLAVFNDLSGTSSAISWSPDGTKIAFSERTGGDVTYNTVDRNGNNLTSIVTMRHISANNLMWSPDGTKILFTSGDLDWPMGSIYLYIVDSDGSNLILLHDNVSRSGATWSHDSSKIVFIAHGDVYVINADGTKMVNITNGNYEYEGRIVWSSDNQKITFQTNSNTALFRGNTYSTNADGTDITMLTVNGDGVFMNMPSTDGTKTVQATMNKDIASLYIVETGGQEPVKIHEGSEDSYVIKWSPDSRKIAFSPYHTYEHIPGVNTIYVINAEGTGIIDLTNISVNMISSGAEFMWSPDSKKIIFTNTIEDNEDIFIIKADGTGLVNFTDHVDRDWAPVLSR